MLTDRVRFPALALSAGLLLLPGTLAGQEAASSSDSIDEKASLPLPAPRSLALDTDEGSWISLDVSPDGSTVVFDLLGDLYTVPLAGGTATRITSGLAFDMQPRFSPDGSTILFVSDRSGGENLWTLELASGDTAQITRGNGASWMSPEWAPDGNYVAASKSVSRLGVHQLWMGHVDGGAGKVLRGEPNQLKTVGAAFTPDGRYIWYSRRMRSWDYNAQFPQVQLAMYDRETGQEFVRTSRFGGAFRPTLSPDGQWLVYGSRHEDQTGLRIRDLDTGEERWLRYPVQRDDQESIADRDLYPGMSFTPDSREVVASYDGRIWRIPVDGGEPTAVPFRVQEDVALGPEVRFAYDLDDAAEFTARQIRDAVPSPDGRRLAFTALDRVYVMDYPNGTPRRLTEGDATEAMPAWSPDGRWLAYVNWTPEGGHVMKVRWNGSDDPVQLTSRAAVYNQPAFSPDGTRIVAIRGPARAYQEATGPFAPGAAQDLVWVSADGGSAQLIAPANGRQGPHFTSDSDRIYLTHGPRGLVSIRWDGTDEKVHVKITGNTRPGAQQPNLPSQILMGPSGDRALAKVNDHLFVVTVPRLGGEAPTISVASPESAPFPVRQVTTIGAEFPAWSADGGSVHWSIGNAHFVYDLERAEIVEDSIAEAHRAEASGDDEAEDEDEAEEDAENDETEGYTPTEHRIRVTVPRDMPEGAVVLRGARVVTMVGDQVLENADVVVRNNRIEQVGASGTLDVPGDAEVIDVGGMTVTPGFVDTHGHMWPQWGVHKNQVWMYLTNLAYGVTTTRDPQTSSSDVVTYGDLVEAGHMPGPRVFSTGPGVFGDYVEDGIEDLDHARRMLKQYSEYYDTKTIKMYMAGNRQQRQWVMIAAKEQGLMPTTEGGLKFGYNITMALDGYPGQEHSWPVAPVYDDVIELFAASGTVYTPTLLVSYGGPWAENYFFSRENPHDDPKLQRFTPHQALDALTRRRGAGWFRDEEHVFQKHAEGVKKLVDAGGKVGVGSHGQLQGLGYHWELWAMQAAAMDEHDALRAATIFGAEALGLEGDLGTVAPGMLADLVILRENPLDDIRNTNTIRYVMKNGRLYDGDTLDEVWPRQQELVRTDWLVADPDATGAGTLSGQPR